MAILPIQAQQSQPLSQKSKIQESRAPKKTEESPQTTATATDQVSFQNKIGEVETSQIVADRVLERVELETSASQSAQASQELFAAAGKTEFQAAAVAAAPSQAPETISPEAAADQIIGGITGYIHKAFESQNPQPTPEDIQNFRQQVVAGFEAGLEDARDILTGLQATTPEVQQAVDQTETLVRERLDTFFQNLQADTAQPAAEETEAVGTL